jgi:hypothetical protein
MHHVATFITVIALVIPVLCQEAASNIGAVRLVARLATRVEVEATGTPKGVIVRRTAADNVVLETEPGESVTVPFTFRANTRSVRIRASADSASITVNVVPVVSTCDWVHSDVVVKQSRVVAVLTRCAPSQTQSGQLHIGSRTQPVTLTIVIDPVSN